MITAPCSEPNTLHLSRQPVELARPWLRASPETQMTGTAFLKNVLVAVDASNPSLVTLRYAAELVSACNAALEALIFVDGRIEPEVGFGQGETTTYLVDEWEAVVREAVAVTRRRIQSLADRRGLSITIRRDVARFEDGIVEASRGASCLVVGREGRYLRQAGLSRDAIAQILKQTSKAVLVTPVECMPIRRVSVVLADPGDDGAALDSALQIARAIQTPLEIAAVAEKHDHSESVLERARWRVGSAPSGMTFTAQAGAPSGVQTWQSPPDCLLIVGISAQRRAGNGQLVDLVSSLLGSAPGPVLFTAGSVETTFTNTQSEPMAAGQRAGKEVDDDVPIAVSYDGVRACALPGSSGEC